MKLIFIVRSLIIIFLFFAHVLTISSCKNTRIYEKHIKELDSLKTVLTQSIDNFKSIDSSLCMQAYTKFYTYNRFIDRNLKDTISTTNAQNLQLFFSVGKPLEQFLNSHAQIIKKAVIQTQQLTNLARDLKNNVIETEDAIAFINNEKQNALHSITELKTNTETARKLLETYNTSLTSVELFIKEINNGILPETINPSLN